MAIADGSIELVKYVRDLAEPHVAGVLHQLSSELTCGKRWTRSPDHYFGGELQATPRPARGDEDNLAISVNASAHTALREHTMDFSDLLPPQRGDRRGIVRLETMVTVSLMVLRGTSAYFQPTSDVGRHGWLCRPDVYRTVDGRMCFLLNTMAGRLWFRRAGQEGPPLIQEIGSLSAHTKSCVVHMAECERLYRLTEPLSLSNGPWHGFQTRDESGRVWAVDSSDVRVGFSCRLDSSAFPDDRLQSANPSLVISPPYDAVWEPAGAGDRRPRIALQLG